ncbi:DUF6346 domain-containing protein [Plantactinospora endophytica]|uniref:DUF3592 domain-containing protein n=1 Tax=Plantactinospora endophytica TaxID=673535 RepID=A0ABQ4E4N5_9ACTN|nr:DUF6346 domain-containing protein [Plantactinospora endophytica]GIG89281.1 hypothetical protein Pen02_42170 [Plantactinospora endophytica]
MEPQDDRIAKRLAEIGEQQRELDRRDAERQSEAQDLGASVVQRPRSNGLRSFLFLTGVLVLAASLIGVAVTLSRLAGKDMADARRTGEATVGRCVEHGPISNRGFGYWESCEVDITWDDGQVEEVTAGVLFDSSDTGTTVRVGDLGRDRTTRVLARADVEARPWLLWIGYGIGVIALLPGFVGVLLLREVLRFRRRR